MTTDQLKPGSLGLLSTRAGDGRTMIGHVVVCRAGSGQEESIAIWHLDTEGARTGAWVTPAAEAMTEPETSLRMLSLCKRKAVLAWDLAEAIETLRALEQVADVAPTNWNDCGVTLPELLSEVADTRTSYAKRVAEEKASKKSIADLEWSIDLPDPLPATVEQLEHLARVGNLVAPTESATEALRISRLGGWIVQRWRETTVALGRPYLRDTFGQPTVLAPTWEARLADAYAYQR
ncbi:DUF6218 family protein [Actinokineospora terrae]|uniref:Uncharacterized protein n=1 Tax=Actinokineospora terrae TaxID=155974 RepID=A0A1H9R007_9PSEU|nr:DUF6218 family protein [Actinokineospora terrae]SER66044.1 hypothetical protein SAMN04487818_104517 [Actinokineospora terrae]